MIPRAACAAFALVTVLAMTASARSLVFCPASVPPAADPAATRSGAPADAVRPAFEGLVAFERGGTALVPALASSWDVSADGLRYTFHLRPGVRFQDTAGIHPSRAFDADDVLYAFGRVWRRDAPDHVDSPAFEATGLRAALRGIDRIDDHTVRLVLTRPEAPLLADLAEPWAFILSAEAAQHESDGGAAWRPVGTGPFVPTGDAPAPARVYAANPDYWGGRPALDRLIFQPVPDAAARAAALRSGACDLIADPAPADLDALRATPGVTVLRQTGLDTLLLALDVQKQPFGDVRVRRAVAMAIDRQAILRAVYGGLAAPASTPVPPAMAGYDDALPPPPAYDPAGSRALLRQAGLQDGFSTLLLRPSGAVPGVPGQVAGMVRADLARVGIDARIADAAAGGQRMAVLDPVSDNADPDSVLGRLLACAAVQDGGNAARWCDNEYDYAVARARAITDAGQRAKLYRRAQAILAREVPWVVIGHAVAATAVRDRVLHYRADPFGGHRFDGVDVR